MNDTEQLFLDFQSKADKEKRPEPAYLTAVLATDWDNLNACNRELLSHTTNRQAWNSAGDMRIHIIKRLMAGLPYIKELSAMAIDSYLQACQMYDARKI